MTEHFLRNRLGFRVSRLAQIMQSRLEGLLAPLGLTRLMGFVRQNLLEPGRVVS